MRQYRYEVGDGSDIDAMPPSAPLASDNGATASAR